jgi:hypothetical protein
MTQFACEVLHASPTQAFVNWKTTTYDFNEKRISSLEYFTYAIAFSGILIF